MLLDPVELVPLLELPLLLEPTLELPEDLEEPTLELPLDPEYPEFDVPRVFEFPLLIAGEELLGGGVYDGVGCLGDLTAPPTLCPALLLTP